MKLSRAVIFTGSFLSFFVQPLVGRTILPYFGGSAAVWIVCLVAFQTLLLLGYGYAFVPARRSGCRGTRIHLALVFLAALLAGSVPAWKAALLTSLSALPPVCGILIAILFLTGLVSLVLSANSTVVQSWSPGGREVYRLYSFGNVGSFAGLLAYPILVEPFVPVSVQWYGLAVLLLLYGLGLAGLSRRVAPSATPATDGPTAPAVSASAGTLPNGKWLWVAIPAATSALMTATTTYLTTDFIPIPLVWAILLAAFLLSYVIGFSRLGEILAGTFSAISVFVLAFAAWAAMPKDDTVLRFAWNGAAALLLLLTVATALHCWLFRIRPEVRLLPHFYFALALGGCLGGVATGLVAPLVFDWVWEYPLMLAVSGALLAYQLYRWSTDETRPLNRIALGVLGVFALMLLFGQCQNDAQDGRTICRVRGFYGIVSVSTTEVPYGDGKKCDFHMFHHGKTSHGSQMMADDVRGKPRGYYSLNGGSIPFVERKDGRPWRGAFVGMGVASLAAVGRPGDSFRFYEISPEVISIATNTAYFTFLSESKAKCEIVEGDARLEMEKDRARGIEKFDIIVIDAYSGDSIPMHLITAEAMELYRSLLKDDGMLAFHISNWHIDLLPIMKTTAEVLGLKALGTFSGPVYSEYVDGTEWVFMTRDAFTPRLPTCCSLIDWTQVRGQRPITDDCGSLLFNIRFGYKPKFIDDVSQF